MRCQAVRRINIRGKHVGIQANGTVKSTADDRQGRGKPGFEVRILNQKDFEKDGCESSS